MWLSICRCLNCRLSMLMENNLRFFFVLFFFLFVGGGGGGGAEFDQSTGRIDHTSTHRIIKLAL